MNSCEKLIKAVRRKLLLPETNRGDNITDSDILDQAELEIVNYAPRIRLSDPGLFASLKQYSLVSFATDQENFSAKIVSKDQVANGLHYSLNQTPAPWMAGSVVNFFDSAGNFLGSSGITELTEDGILVSENHIAARFIAGENQSPFPDLPATLFPALIDRVALAFLSMQADQVAYGLMKDGLAGKESLAFMDLKTERNDFPNELFKPVEW